MKYIDLQIAFELEINKLDDALTKPKSDDIEYWLNIGLDKFVKTRYSGVNYKSEGFEQSQKRIDDLRTLVTYKLYQYPPDNVYNFTYVFRYATSITQEQLDSSDYLTIDKKYGYIEYLVTIPTDYMFALGDDTYIVSNDNNWPITVDGNFIPKRVPVLEVTSENITEKLNNSLSEYRLHGNYARPLRIFVNNKITLISDDNYIVEAYLLTYLRRPNKIDLSTTPFEEYIDMPAHTHTEIVKLAAQAYLENQSNQRYNSYSNEIATME